ncbi:tetratricopeptide repeat protein, partial [Paracoccaceae bacterium]|nr:tetratricopeptide repeat protein [Paracoccaceae bacterium]
KLSVVNALSKADSHLKKREYSAAKELYLSILKVFPNNKKAQKGLSFINKQAGTHVNQQNLQNSLNQLLNIYSQGNPDQAYDYAKSLLKQYPNAAGILNILGASAAQIGDLEAAASAFRKIISINPSQASGYYNLGNVLRDNQKFDEALEAYDKALNLKPDYEAALNNLILIIRDMYRPDDPTIQKYIKSHNIRDSIGPHTEQSDFDRGNILQQRGHFEGAIAAYSKALSIEPNNANLYNNIGIAYANLKRFDAAIEAYKKAIALEPTNASFHNNVGISYAGIGEHNVAIDAYNKALSLKSDYPEVYYNMASALSESGQLERAIWAYEQALTIRPNYASAWYNMGLKLSALGEQDRAVKAYAKVLECETDHIAASYNMAILLKDLGQWDEAIAAYRKVLSIKPDHAEAYNNMGVIFQEKNEFSAAIDAYDQAIRIQPSYTSAWYNKGMAFYEQGEFQSAIIAYRKVLSIKPDHAEAYNNMGIALSNMGQHEQAIDACKKAIEIKPDYANAYNNLGLAYADLGDANAAIIFYENSLSIYPDAPECHNNLGLALSYQGHFEQAIERYKQAISLKEDYSEVYSNLGTTLHSCGRLPEAFDAFEKSISLTPYDAEVHHNYSLALLAGEQFRKGFELTEWRFQTKKRLGHYLDSTKPSWKGESQQRVLVWGEQGIGDEIMFSSMVPELCKNCSEVIIRCDDRLIPLFQRSFPMISKYYGRDEIVPEDLYDFHIPSGSLACFYRHSIKSFQNASSGFLECDRQRQEHFRDQLLSGTNKQLIGLSWKTKSTLKNAQDRNINLSDLAKKLDSPNSVLINLQYGEVDDEISALKSEFGIDVVQLSDLDVMNDIDGLAALISACDRVVSTTNVTVHLAGALGKDVTVLLPYAPRWIWGSGNKSFWYNSAQPVKQKAYGDWESVLETL